MRAFLIALAAAAVVWPAAAQASPVTVANNSDSGPGSLRAAIAAANPGDTIVIPASIGTVALTSGQIPVTKNLTIQGASSSRTVISGGNSSRIFCVRAPACPAPASGTQPSLSLTDLKLTDGNVTTAADGDGGGAIAISAGALSLTRVDLTSNNATTANHRIAGGGAIYGGAADVTIADSTIGPMNTVKAGPHAGDLVGGGAIWDDSGAITIKNTHVDDNAVDLDGTASSVGGGGAIFSGSGDVTLKGTTVSRNSLTDVVANSNGLGGGGIYAESGHVSISDTRVDDNTATINDSATARIDGGGGLFVGAAFTAAGSTVSGNSFKLTAGNDAKFNGAGGLYDNGGGVFLTDTTLADDAFTFTAGTGAMRNGGGAIYNAGGSTDIARSTIGPGDGASLTVGSGDALNGGGGIFKGGGTATIADATIASSALSITGSGGNSGGGALFTDGDAAFRNATLVANTSNVGISLVASENATITIGNSLISTSAGAIGADCAKIGPTTFVNDGPNLSNSSTCGLGAGAKPATDLGLGPLASNGGPTKTFALLPGSRAIDRGANALCPTVDQRGVVRPQGSACDIGAFEFVPPAPAPVADPPPVMNPPATPPSFRGVTLKTRTVAVKRNAVRVRIFCPTGTCVGKITLRASHRQLGAARFSIAAHKTTNVRIKLTHATQRLLKHHHRLSAIATVTATSNSVTTKGQHKVTLKRRT